MMSDNKQCEDHSRIVLASIRITGNTRKYKAIILKTFKQKKLENEPEIINSSQVSKD